MTFPLIDGPLINRAFEHRREQVARMAAILVEEDAFQNEQDAITLLSHRGFGTLEIFTLIVEVRYLARQEVVAREISAP